MKENTQKIYHKLNNETRKEIDLVIDRVYEANPLVKNIKSEVLSKMFSVGNAGGFRIIGKQNNPKLIVLYTTGENIYWKDEIDSELGLFTYYGDNQKPGSGLHETKLGGNKALSQIFSLASHADINLRKMIPPIFIFQKANVKSGRDVKFLGLAVPGYKGKKNSDWLTAVWSNRTEGGRFQNYKALFTIIDTSKGSQHNEKNANICLAWVDDIINGNAYQSCYAPSAWKGFVKSSKYIPLVAKLEKQIRLKEDQLPSTILGKKLLRKLTEFYNKEDNGLNSYDFERFAIDVTQAMNPNVISIEPTKKYKDGGFDGIGKYRIFDKVENTIIVEFYLEAKCYSENNSVGVRETSRLISRIKNRQFGILFTTSFIAKQAYEEILQDEHPIVLITGNDIINYLIGIVDIKSLNEFELWLKVGYSITI